MGSAEGWCPFMVELFIYFRQLSGDFCWQPLWIFLHCNQLPNTDMKAFLPGGIANTCHTAKFSLKSQQLYYLQLAFPCLLRALQ